MAANTAAQIRPRTDPQGALLATCSHRDRRPIGSCSRPGRGTRPLAAYAIVPFYLNLQWTVKSPA
jgi:hypothetical protein